jgi:hypothetical protein
MSIKRHINFLMSSDPQCVRCGHIATVGSSEPFLETPCSHLYCGKCVHRLFALQSRISCSACNRGLFRHELTASSSSKEDQLYHIVAATRKRVYAIMNKIRDDFEATPAYDDFLEMRENLVNKFIQVYDTIGALVHTSSPPMSREDLEKILHKFEVDNQEQIISNRSNADDKKRRKIEEIIETEGTLYDRINVDYAERDSVLDHELATQYADLLSKKDGPSLTQHTSENLINRKTRVIQQPPATAATVPPQQVPMVAEASGCKDIWRTRALESILSAFQVV